MAVNNPLNISETGIITHDGEGDFLGRSIISENGLSIQNGDGVIGDIKILGVNATTQSSGVVKLADRKEIDQNIAPPDSVLTVDSLKSFFIQPFFWVCFNIDKKNHKYIPTFISGYNIGPESLRSDGSDFFVFKESSSLSMPPPIICSGFCNECPYTWKVNCVYSVQLGVKHEQTQAKGIEIKIFPLFNASMYTAYSYYPITIYVLSLGPW